MKKIILILMVTMLMVTLAHSKSSQRFGLSFLYAWEDFSFETFNDSYHAPGDLGNEPCYGFSLTYDLENGIIIGLDMSFWEDTVAKITTIGTIKLEWETTVKMDPISLYGRYAFQKYDIGEAYSTFGLTLYKAEFDEVIINHSISRRYEYAYDGSTIGYFVGGGFEVTSYKNIIAKTELNYHYAEISSLKYSKAYEPEYVGTNVTDIEGNTIKLELEGLVFLVALGVRF